MIIKVSIHHLVYLIIFISASNTGNHYYAMNDSCYNSSLIEIIIANYDFEFCL